MAASQSIEAKKPDVPIPTNGYHWIGKAIDSLNPYTDYDLVWKLMSSYKTSDFLNNLNYTIGFPNFTIFEHSAEVAWRADGGKVVHKGAGRAEASEQSNMIWWRYGSQDKRTQSSVEGVNKIHANLARQYPGHFSHNDDYLYVLSSSAVALHRLRLTVGLPGLPENQKIAAHLYWKNMAPLFHVEQQGPVRDFPGSFEECLRFAERYEGTPRPFTLKGRNVALSILHLFAYRYFPPGFRWLGVAWARALVTPVTLRNYRIDPVHPLLAVILLFVTKLLLIVTGLLPDPKMPFIDTLNALPEAEKRKRAVGIKALDKSYARFFEHNVDVQACPHSAKFD